MSGRKQKVYRYGDRRMTTSEVLACCPNPLFFDRAHDRMSRAEVEAIVLRNVAEIRRWLSVAEGLAKGNYAGRLTKRALITDANEIHNWRAGMNVMTGSLGQGHFWEE